MIDPDLMCIQHTFGEHRELHALKGSLERTKSEYDNHERHRKNLTTLALQVSIQGGYEFSGILQPMQTCKKRLACYMDDRGWMKTTG